MSTAPNVPITLTGLLAAKSDLAPSIVFIVAFALLIPVGIWRFAVKSTRTPVLIRPLIFCVLRVATYVVRAMMANGSYSIGIIIAEAVLVGSAGVLVIEPLIKLSRSLLETVPYSGSQKLDFLGRPARRRDYVGVIGGVLDTGLLISLVLAIYSATQTGDAYKSADKAHLVTELRRVSAIIYCVIVAILIVALLYFHMQHTLASRPTYYLLFVAILMMVTCAYRLASAYGNAGARTRAAFWLALALPELIVAILFFSVNLKTLVPEKPQAVDPNQNMSMQPLNGPYSV